MKMIKIVNCSDPLFWYADKVGTYHKVLREQAEYYMCREPAGYLNIVLKKDAEIHKCTKTIEVIPNTFPYNDAYKVTKCIECGEVLDVELI